ncbi:MAG: ferritin-like domain-containing protein [Anaerolineae bacterium]
MSEHWKAIEEVIRQAIVGEEDSHALYVHAAGRVKDPNAKAMLEELAKDELGHKAKLESLLKRGLTWEIVEGEFKKVQDLKLGDHLVAEPLDEQADLQAVLTTAIRREKESHDLYAAMAGVTCDETVRSLFEFLANEELTHKRKLESTFEDIVYQQF